VSTLGVEESSAGHLGESLTLFTRIRVWKPANFTQVMVWQAVGALFDTEMPRMIYEICLVCRG